MKGLKSLTIASTLLVSSLVTVNATAGCNQTGVPANIWYAANSGQIFVNINSTWCWAAISNGGDLASMVATAVANNRRVHLFGSGLGFSFSEVKVF